jgi:hypothetical protein
MNPVPSSLPETYIPCAKGLHKTVRLPLWLVKLLNYEYWDWWVFYLPLLPFWFYYAFKARSFTFFTAVNPGIPGGGFFGESKIAILDHIPEVYKPQTLFISQALPYQQVISRLRALQLGFPLIAKPDVGERGTQVEKLIDEKALEAYMSNYTLDFIIQEYVDFPLEMGVMYHRIPGENQGKVTSITLKHFLSVTGDGHSTIRQLMEASDRARFQLPRMEKQLGQGMEQVLPAGQQRVLEPIGNHCRGTLFYSGNHLINETLQQVFNQIATSLEGFCYGRFDMRVSSLEDLYAGRNIRILEFNGVSAEPAHIYDPSYTLLKAYRDFLYHVDIVYHIARQNMQNGIRPLSFRQMCQITYAHFTRKA